MGLIKKFENSSSLVMTDHYFQHCNVLLTVLLCQAKSMKANETSNKHLKLVLSNCLELLLFKVYLLTGIPNNIRFNNRF